jgi:class 3 adenylate cyclase/tetratricopeptide (TPR) repeat protein
VRCGEVNPERARFCLGCGAAVSDGFAGGGESRKTVTVLFCDVVGSTGVGEALDPESVREMLSMFFTTARSIIGNNGGTVEKFIGDAVLAAFGVPVLHEDDARRAVLAAVQLREALPGLNAEFDRRWGLRIAVRMGVNTGEVVTADPGSGQFFVGGDAVNVAARLEQAARPGEILVGEQTWRLVRREVQLEPVESLALRGRSALSSAWRVLGVDVPVSGRGEPLRSGVVGRTGDLAVLQTVFAQVQSGRGCRVATVVGAPGVGKSHLVKEFVGWLGPNVTVAKGRCIPDGEGTTFGPAAEVIRSLAAIGTDNAPEQVRARLHSLLPEGAASAAAVNGILDVLGLGAATAREESFWAVRFLLEACAARRTVVLVLEDLHWAEPTLIDFVEQLPRWCDDSPILVIAVGRPELMGMRPALFGDGPEQVCLGLTGLSVEAIEVLAQQVLGAVVDPEVVAHVVAVSQGNPLFAVESLRMLLDDGVLRRRQGVWCRSDPQAALTIPPTIRALLSARLDRLAGPERVVIERASVVGKEFRRAPVAALSPPPVASTVQAQLARLIERQLVARNDTAPASEQGYHFTHVLIRDAAYDRLLKHDRALLHERLADWIEERSATTPRSDDEGSLGYHLEQACLYRRELSRADEHSAALGRRAAAHLQAASERALTRGDHPAATNLLDRAQRQLPAGDPEQLEILLSLVECRVATADVAGASATLGALDTLVEATDPGQVVAARIQVGRCELRLLSQPERLADDVAVLRAALEVLTTAGEPRALSRTHTVLGRSLAVMGRLEDAERELDRALVRARECGDSARARQVLLQLPVVVLWGPLPVAKASGRLVDTLRVLRLRPGNRLVEAEALRCLAPLEAMRGRFEAATTLLASSRAIFSELGSAAGLAECQLTAGLVELMAGQAETACGVLELAYHLFTDTGVTAGAAEAAAWMAEARYRTGAWADAATWAALAERERGTSGRRDAVWVGVQAKLAARNGDHTAAGEWARRGVALVEGTDALVDRADAQLNLAEVLLLANRAEDAETHQRVAAHLYDAKGHLVGIARAMSR